MSSSPQDRLAPAGPSSARAARAPSAASGVTGTEDFARQESSHEVGDGDVAIKRKRHRAGKKRRNRRQSFAAPSDQTDDTDTQAQTPGLQRIPESSASQSAFYRLGARAQRSNTSLDSQALLDHRDQYPTRARRSSLLQNTYAPQLAQSIPFRQSTSMQPPPSLEAIGPKERRRTSYHQSSYREDSGDETDTNDRTPLISDSKRQTGGSPKSSGYSAFMTSSGNPARPHRPRRASESSSTSGRRRVPQRQQSSNQMPDYDVNNPPSVPGSPRLGGNADFDDVMLPEFDRSKSPEKARNFVGSQGRDAVIDIDQDVGLHNLDQEMRAPASEMLGGHAKRQQGQAVVEDVCVPFDDLTDLGDEDFLRQEAHDPNRFRRSHKRPWPDISALEEWSREEKEHRTAEGVRAKKVNEPVLVGGRLRPQLGTWRREDEDEPFRWTYFNEELDTSIRSHTISGLQQVGHNFRELFIPDPPEIEDDSSDEDGEYGIGPERAPSQVKGQQKTEMRQSSILDAPGFIKQTSSGEHTGRSTPSKPNSGDPKPKRFGPRPVFWLDVLQPTYDEMRVLSRAFGIHKLTAEDIMEQEPREKVELFRNYYFVNYRTFEQDEKSEDFMDPVNMYFVVFKGGVISFHFSQMPHPPNVRRRIRQLAEHQYTDSDWIAYAIIDNITDTYAPLIEQIEEEVDDIDDKILCLHNDDEKHKTAEVVAKKKKKTHSDAEKVMDDPELQADRGRQADNMLLRVGECRKKVMGLYRLLSNKADVIKGLAKRCNEQWQVAPRSDVGLYLGDIQDHIVTMTGNLTHYESILSRAHSNYLAQISIKMNERAEETSDVLGKLTVLGTIVLPMNIITGMWGMNVMVPGQGVDNLWWFWSLTAFLMFFGGACFLVAKKVYGLV